MDVKVPCVCVSCVIFFFTSSPSLFALSPFLFFLSSSSLFPLPFLLFNKTLIHHKSPPLLPPFLILFRPNHHSQTHSNNPAESTSFTITKAMAFIDINLVLAQPFFLCSLVLFLVRAHPSTPLQHASFHSLSLHPSPFSLLLPHASYNSQQRGRETDNMAHHMLSNTVTERLLACV